MRKPRSIAPGYGEIWRAVIRGTVRSFALRVAVIKAKTHFSLI